MRKAFFVLLLLFVVGCASGPADKQGPVETAAVEPAVESRLAPSVSAKEAEAKVKATPPSEYVQLREAIQSGDPSRVSEASYQMLMKNPQDYKTLNGVAMYYYRQGNLGMAKLYLGKALEINKASELYNNLGLIALAENDQLAAIANFKRSLQLNPHNGAAAANLGAIYVAAKDYRKARVALPIAYKEGVRSLSTLNNYAVTLASQGQHREAESMFKEAMKINSNHQTLMMNYAIYLADQRKSYREAQELVDKIRFIGVQPDLRSSLDQLDARIKSGLK